MRQSQRKKSGIAVARTLSSLLDLEQERSTELVSAALASLQMVRSGAGRPEFLLDAAMDRLQALLAVMRLTSDTPACEDVAEALPHLCRYVLISREERRRINCALTDTSLVLDRRTARLVLRIAQELVEVALECTEFDDQLRVFLARKGDRLILQIGHSRPRAMPPRSARRRIRLSRQLVRPEGGRIVVYDRPPRTFIQFTLPLPFEIYPSF